MKLSELDYAHPESLIAREPRHPPRVWLNDRSGSREVSFEEIFGLFERGDVLLVNNTRVEKRRVINSEGLEILFVGACGAGEWEVLFPSRSLATGDLIALPGNLKAQLLSKGLPQKIKVLGEMAPDYFERFGEPALPPYIQKSRGERRSRTEDERWYQTDWAEKAGSSAAPTASLHFQKSHLEQLQSRGVEIGWLTLHVGLGTFLPVKTEDLTGHKMHGEWVEVPRTTIARVEASRNQGRRIWALGTTALRSIEAWAQGHLKQEGALSVSGVTDLFIYPGYEFKVVSGLLTNFHQPRSTLLALVSAFYGHRETMASYREAVQREFRLFSYGDLSVWIPRHP